MAQITKRITQAGTYRYDVRTRIGGRVVTKTFKRRKDADSYASTTEADKVRGVAIDPRRAEITVKEYANQWLGERVDLATRTAELYRYDLDRHILPRFGSISMGAVTVSAVRSWHSQLAKETPSTAAKCYRILATIMKTAVTDGIIIQSPCRVPGASSEKSTERSVATIAEVAALAEAMPERLRIAVLLATYCQLRRAEVLGLRRRDVDLLRGTVQVSVTRGVKMSGAEVVKAPKSEAGRRTITIPSNVLGPLEHHLDHFTEADPDAYVLPMGNKVITRWWGRARLTIGRPDLRFHDLRHTGLTLAAATGASTAELMHRGGHSFPAAAFALPARNRGSGPGSRADALAELATNATVIPDRLAR